MYFPVYFLPFNLVYKMLNYILFLFLFYFQARLQERIATRLEVLRKSSENLVKPQKSVQALDFMEQRLETFKERKEYEENEFAIFEAQTYEESPAVWEHNRRARKERENVKSHVGNLTQDKPIYLPPIGPVNACGYPPTHVTQKIAERERERIKEAKQEAIEKARAYQSLHPSASEAELRLLKQVYIRQLLT